MNIVLLVLLALTSPALAQSAKQSSFELMKPETQAMQRDDAMNPALLWVQEGRVLWSRREGAENRSCADCHGALETMKGAAARYPAYHPSRKTMVTLDQQIALCRADKQKAEPLKLESRPLLSLSAAIGMQSRGLPIVPIGHAEEPAAAEGKRLFTERRGQMNLSCAQCHDDHAGQSLGGAIIPQGHPTAYPLYRLEWQDIGSLERRFRNCMIGVRSEPSAYGAADLVALATYLRDRAAGLPIETPGVRP